MFRAFETFVAFLVIAAGGAAQAERDPVAELERAFEKRGHDEEALVKIRAAVGAASSVDNAAVVDALVDGYTRLEHDAVKIAEARRRLLAKGGGSRELGPLRHEVQPLRDLQHELLDELGKRRTPDAVQAMVARVFRSTRTLPLTLRLELAARAGDVAGDGLDWLDEPGSRRDESEAFLLLRAIGALGPRGARAGAWVVEQLEHDDAAIRVAAATALGELAWPGAIEPLIDRIDAERGVAREAVLDALVVLTAVDPGDTEASWRAWLAQDGARYLSGEARLGQGDAAVRQRTVDQRTTTGQYFGIAQSGEAILYVVDVSLSMRRSMGGERGRGRGRGGRSGPPGEDSRWARCKKELLQALDSLTPAKTFNVVGFANELEIFSPRMVKASKRNLRRARRWIEELELELETNVYDALEFGFDLAGRGAQDRYYEPEVDTIYFLSDGAPTLPPKSGPATQERGPGGGFRFPRDDPRQILAEVRRWNALGRVVVHTIGIGLGDGERRRPGGGGGDADTRQFMRDLAAQNRGVFVEPD